ncbi:MAG: glycerophosphodiester phosphodiesterase family protein, partial [Pseudomonadota bacterium]
MPIKIFAHRGLVAEKIKENTLAAFQNAYKNNFRAFEIDIWYLKNQLVLKHNRPNNLSNLTKLKDCFGEFQNQVEYWLDFKNLHSKNCAAAIKAVKKIVDDLKIKPEQIYFAP